MSCKVIGIKSFLDEDVDGVYERRCWIMTISYKPSWYKRLFSAGWESSYWKQEGGHLWHKVPNDQLVSYEHNIRLQDAWCSVPNLKRLETHERISRGRY